MYKKLLPYLNQFVYVRQGAFSRSYIGRLVSIDPETIEIQTYYEDGTDADVWVVSVSTITEFSSKSRLLSTLALKVKWISSQQESGEESAAEEPAELNLSHEA